MKELDEFLLARAMEHDSPTLLFRLACEFLIPAKVIRPGPVTVVKRVSARPRGRAGRDVRPTGARVHRRAPCRLDGLLVTDPVIGMSRLRWLGKGPVEASPAAVEAEIAKLEFLRGMDAHALDLSVLPAERRRFLAMVGRRLTAQALQRREPERRYPILLTLVAQSATEVLDEIVQLFDQALSARESKAAHRMWDALAERAKSGEDRQALLDAILAIVADPAVPDEDVGGLIRDERIGGNGCARRPALSRSVAPGSRPARADGEGGRERGPRAPAPCPCVAAPYGRAGQPCGQPCRSAAGAGRAVEAEGRGVGVVAGVGALEPERGGGPGGQ
ncbi:hypothetical protein [Microbispora rosea]|uniref:hypothetical protein n=1 Tax=Microbispora rosea TaxID=58117 RepID=UPI0034473B2E